MLYATNTSIQVEDLRPAKQMRKKNLSQARIVTQLDQVPGRRP